MIRCIVFDFDGTLVDSNRIKRETFVEIAEEFGGGRQVMADLLQVGAGRDRYWIFDSFADALPGRPDARALVDRYSRTCEEKIARAPEINGARNCLDRLSGDGKLLYVNSATPNDHLERLIHLRRMQHWFKGICGSPAAKHENLWRISRENGLRFDEMLVVGDGESDRASAASTGCYFVAIDHRDNDFSSVPDCRVPDLVSLPDIVAAMS